MRQERPNVPQLFPESDTTASGDGAAGRLAPATLEANVIQRASLRQLQLEPEQFDLHLGKGGFNSSVFKYVKFRSPWWGRCCKILREADKKKINLTLNA